MNEIESLLLSEKYRPKEFKDLVFNGKDKLLKYLEHPKKCPSMIFTSWSPGTGKTTTAKIIIRFFDCDSIVINSSDERGIDTIRDKITNFCRSLSSNNKVKRCVFLDEADGLTKTAQDSLRNLMETYSENCFFILSCNDSSKIIDPIKSRCVLFSFDKPDEEEIVNRLLEICQKEKIKITVSELCDIVKMYYPDVRRMIGKIEERLVGVGVKISDVEEEYEKLLGAIKSKNIDYIYTTVYSGKIELLEFNKWFFKRMMKEWKTIGQEKCTQICLLLAENEKNYNLGVNLEIVFLANMMLILKLF